MLYDENIIQDKHIFTDEELEPLKRVKIVSTRGKSPNTYSTSQDLYTANDTEFMKWLEEITKIKKEALMKELGDDGSSDEGGGWNNANRLERRLSFLEKYKKYINVPNEFKPLVRIEFTTKAKKKKNCYTATNEEFIEFFAKVTKTKQEKLLKDVEDQIDEKRLELRLAFIKRFKRSIERYQGVDKK